MVRKLIRQILNEVMIEPHFDERLYTRFLDKENVSVGYEIPGKVGVYQVVGTYVLPSNLKEDIRRNGEIVKNYNFPKNKSYGVKLAGIIIDKNTVSYISNELRNEAKDKTLIFLDDKTDSNGNLIYAIIRENRAVTVYFAKSYSKQDNDKLRVDFVINKMDVLINKKLY